MPSKPLRYRGPRVAGTILDCSGATTDMLQSNDRDLHSTP